MVSIMRSLGALLLAAGVLVSGAWDARGATEVDLALVLAVDVSRSMEPDEQELQREGFVEAFRSHDVHHFIRQGLVGRIAVTYVEWAGASNQWVVVPWTVIEQPEDAIGFAVRLAQSPTRSAAYTSLSGAIDFSARLLQGSDLAPVRRVIDISGDGANNQGRAVTEARDEAVSLGIAINGLPIMLNQPNSIWDIDNLDLYFRDCVIGGPGAFMIPVRQGHQFVEAIKAKILREISDLGPSEALIRPTQAPAPTNCLKGELRP
jgi:Protein of unknown function (DUF1194)